MAAPSQPPPHQGPLDPLGSPLSFAQRPPPLLQRPLSKPLPSADPSGRRSSWPHQQQGLSVWLLAVGWGPGGGLSEEPQAARLRHPGRTAQPMPTLTLPFLSSPPHLSAPSPPPAASVCLSVLLSVHPSVSLSSRPSPPNHGFPPPPNPVTRGTSSSRALFVVDLFQLLDLRPESMLLLNKLLFGSVFSLFCVCFASLFLLIFPGFVDIFPFWFFFRLFFWVIFWSLFLTTLSDSPPFLLLLLLGSHFSFQAARPSKDPSEAPPAEKPTSGRTSIPVLTSFGARNSSISF